MISARTHTGLWPHTCNHFIMNWQLNIHWRLYIKKNLIHKVKMLFEEKALRFFLSSVFLFRSTHHFSFAHTSFALLDFACTVSVCIYFILFVLLSVHSMRINATSHFSLQFVARFLSFHHCTRHGPLCVSFHYFVSHFRRKWAPVVFVLSMCFRNCNNNKRHTDWRRETNK